jgi:hypothetical protein
LLVLTFVLASTEGALAQNKCAGAKIKASGKKVKCLLGLEAKEAKSGTAPDPAKVQKCRDKLASTFAKNEAKGGCPTTGDAQDVEDKVDAFVADVDSELGVGLPNGCQASKLKAAGKKATCLLGLEAKEASKGTVPPPDKIQKCRDKLASTFSKAELKGGCSTTADAQDIEDKVDAFVADADGELAPPTTSTTTSTTVTTTVTTTTGTGPTTTSTTTTVTTTSTTTTTVFTPDWGLDCFAPMTCGPTHCPMFGAQCTDYIESVGLPGGTEMCFFDCMDMGLKDVTDCRDSCGGSAAPVCETGVAGGGGFPGVVTGPGKCTPTGFAASVFLGGSATEFKRILVDFTTPIDEASLFTVPPPPCSGTCPSPGSACDVGAPYAAMPFADVFRLQVGAASPPPEVCDRLGVATSVCKYGPMGYAFIVTPPGISAPAAAPIDLTLFISCHVSSGGGTSFLHFSTGDFFLVGSWPP